jgi:LPXTG-site transpeptidase (sortase) family protein
VHRAPSDLLWRVVRTAGELALTLGVVVLLFVAYEVWGTDLVAAQAQGRLGDELHAQWGTETGSTGAGPTGAALPELTTAPAVGAPFAFLHVPRLGADWSRAVVEGTAQEQLAQGPGHYAGTALPGEPGNFAVAGHRVGRGSPFLDADTLRPGDPLVVETAGWWYVYRVLGSDDPSGIPGSEVVAPTDVSVIDPLPDGAAGAAPDGAYLTLTTCNPKFSARERLVVHGRLDGPPVSRRDAPDGPAALREGTAPAR